MSLAQLLMRLYGTDIIDLRFLYAFDAIRKRDDGKTTHWLALLYTALIDPKHAKNNEPFKIDEIGWFKINELPSPLHSQIPLQLKAIKSKMKAAGVI
jgi:8-oxo-dGTP diphosphatase